MKFTLAFEATLPVFILQIALFSDFNPLCYMWEINVIAVHVLYSV